MVPAAARQFPVWSAGGAPVAARLPLGLVQCCERAAELGGGVLVSPLGLASRLCAVDREIWSLTGSDEVNREVARGTQ